MTVSVFDTPPRWLASHWGPGSKVIAVAMAYLIGAEVAFYIGTLSDRVFAPFWPPNIILLCAFISTPAKDWWIYILAVFPIHVFVEIAAGMPAPQLLVAFATNCLVAVLNAIAMRALMRGHPWFESVRSALCYILLTAFASPALVAIAGAFVPILGGGKLEQYWTFWLQWYLSNALACLTLGPVALLAVSQEPSMSTLSAPQKVEGLVVAIALGIVSMLAFRFSIDHAFNAFIPAIALVPLTFVIWAAIRFGAIGASVAIFITTVGAIQQTLSEVGQFAIIDSESAVFGLQMLLIVLALPVLLLGAAIEETRRAIKAARTNEELMALSASAADSCLWQYNRKTQRFWMTENGRSMFGLNASDPLTRVSIEQSLHPDDRQAAIETMRSAAQKKSFADTEFRIMRNGSEMRWLRARGRETAEGDISVISGTFSDITDKKKAEHEVAQRQNEIAHLMRVSMLGELSGGIAHELTQPLTAILSNAQAARVLIDKENPDLVEISEVLDDIISDDHRAGEVIHKMRGLLKRGEAKFEAIEPADVINSTLQLLHSELINRRVKVTCLFDDHLPLICGDRVQLQQVLLNLVMNAVDSMSDQAPSRRMIAISTHVVDGGEVAISITDQGSGLTSTQEKVFQPFFTTKERGLGLGLSICASIIKAHSGKLSLKNSPLGGAIATFTLPRHS